MNFIAHDDEKRFDQQDVTEPAPLSPDELRLVGGGAMVMNVE